jgi:alkylation response protein AidB-like acyl-CoA dehydrogenase
MWWPSACSDCRAAEIGNAVHFAFTAQQREFRDAVRQLLANECTTGDLRLAFESPAARSPRWTRLAAMGVVGLSVPENLGGLGLGQVDLVPLLEESGRVALPEPLVESTALTAPLLADLAQADPAVAPSVSPWLSGIAKGDVAAAVGGMSADPPSGPATVAGATGADLFVLATVGRHGPEIHVLGSDRVAVTPVASLDPTRRLGVVEWSPTPDTRVVSGPEATAGMARTADRAAVATAAQLLGLSDRMIGMAAEYAKGRHQFGKAIGSFQAVKHMLAGAQVRLEFARPAVYAAGWSLDQGEPTGSRAASTAKALASDAATEAARVSLQVHGAIGYTWECDLHLFLKRAWALAEAWGSASDHRQSVLASLTELP